jgi:hypothetical protein
MSDSFLLWIFVANGDTNDRCIVKRSRGMQ